MDRSKRRETGGWLGAVGLCAVMLGTATPARGEPTVPNSFSGGTTISASQVNQNFAALTAAMPTANVIYNYNNGSLANGAGGAAGTVVDLVGMTMTPPVDGVVLVTAGALLTITQTATGSDTAVIGVDMEVGGAHAAGAVASGRVSLDTTGGHPQMLSSMPTLSWAFSVTGGVATTFIVYARKMSGLNQASYNQPWMTALFVPGRFPCTAAAGSGNYGCN